ncbi:hypothetical protein [Nocardioides lijunqiniae]|uniref:hypothetical protein n=1 Tax=Nocardioides lijunqiniae TaxID=2760832 RepID=UPI001877CBF1|nr:hypothetical protein [Nocardioides lijunqiniae]
MLRNTRALPAALVVAVVLLVAVAGGATAAKLITGKQIKNGTVTSADLKNNNVSGTDLKNGSVGSADLANGGVSLADLAPQARTSLKSDSHDGLLIAVPTCNDNTLVTCENLLTVPVVPGTQLVTASGDFDNLDADNAINNTCGLVQGGVLLNVTRFVLTPNFQPGEVENFTLQQVITVPDASQPVHLRCSEGDDDMLRLVRPRLTSIKVS